MEPYQVSEPSTTSVSTRAITDVAAIAVPIVTAVMQFMRDEHSYEVIFLSIAFLALYGYLKALLGRIEELKIVLRDITAQYQADLTRVNRKHELYVQISNATVANLFSDVSSFAGERRIGSLTVEPESGAMLYTKFNDVVPPGQERRGRGPAPAPATPPVELYQRPQP